MTTSITVKRNATARCGERSGNGGDENSCVCVCLCVYLHQSSLEARSPSIERRVTCLCSVPPAGGGGGSCMLLLDGCEEQRWVLAVSVAGRQRRAGGGRGVSLVCKVSLLTAGKGTARLGKFISRPRSGGHHHHQHHHTRSWRLCAPQNMRTISRTQTTPAGSLILFFRWFVPRRRSPAWSGAGCSSSSQTRGCSPAPRRFSAAPAPAAGTKDRIKLIIAIILFAIRRTITLKPPSGQKQWRTRYVWDAGAEKLKRAPAHRKSLCICSEERALYHLSSNVWASQRALS